MANVYEVGDVIRMKKKHPCGSYEWEILRVGADFPFKMHRLWTSDYDYKKISRKKHKRNQKKCLKSVESYGIVLTCDILLFADKRPRTIFPCS